MRTQKDRGKQGPLKKSVKQKVLESTLKTIKREIPVSYTHLDVYKRQIFVLISISCKIHYHADITDFYRMHIENFTIYEK